MQVIARLFQLAGLAIPLLAMVAQLRNRIGAGQMLQFLLVAACLFGVGYILQVYGPRK